MKFVIFLFCHLLVWLAYGFCMGGGRHHFWWIFICFILLLNHTKADEENIVNDQFDLQQKSAEQEVEDIDNGAIREAVAEEGGEDGAHLIDTDGGDDENGIRDNRGAQGGIGDNMKDDDGGKLEGDNGGLNGHDWNRHYWRGGKLGASNGNETKKEPPKKKQPITIPPDKSTNKTTTTTKKPPPTTPKPAKKPKTTTAEPPPIVKNTTTTTTTTKTTTTTTTTTKKTTTTTTTTKKTTTTTTTTKKTTTTTTTTKKPTTKTTTTDPTTSTINTTTSVNLMTSTTVKQAVLGDSLHSDLIDNDGADHASHSSSWWIVAYLVLFVLVVSIVVGGFYYWRKRKHKKGSTRKTVSQQESECEIGTAKAISETALRPDHIDVEKIKFRGPLYMHNKVVAPVQEHLLDNQPSTSIKQVEWDDSACEAVEIGSQIEKLKIVGPESECSTMSQSSRKPVFANSPVVSVQAKPSEQQKKPNSSDGTNIKKNEAVVRRRSAHTSNDRK